MGWNEEYYNFIEAPEVKVENIEKVSNFLTYIEIGKKSLIFLGLSGSLLFGVNELHEPVTKQFNETLSSFIPKNNLESIGQPLKDKASEFVLEKAIENNSTTVSIPAETTTTLSEQSTTTIMQPTTTLPPITTTTLEQLIQPATAVEKINSVTLTMDEYKQFLFNINKDYIPVASMFREFNPNLNDVPQNKTEFFNWHFTVARYDGDGVNAPLGEFDPNKFIKSIANSFGPNTTCCAVNYVIDRNAKTYQLALNETKLKHNYPYNGSSIGVEIESPDQISITPEQYKASMYLTIASLKSSGLLDINNLGQTALGHGEMTDEYNIKNPEDKNAELRNDFDKAESDAMRSKIYEFVLNYPEIDLIDPKLP